jgi:hypothetical protein
MPRRKSVLATAMRSFENKRLGLEGEGCDFIDGDNQQLRLENAPVIPWTARGWDGEDEGGAIRASSPL